MIVVHRKVARALVLTLALIAAHATAAHSQSQSSSSADLPPQVLSLDDLRAFRAPSASWRIVGGASALAEGASTLATTSGAGVLAFVPSSAAPATLATTWSHGDIDLSFDMLAAQGSKARVLMMGRYGVSLADSWTNGPPGLSTIGAVAPPRSGERGTFDGTAPRLNAARAPGLWQHVDIVFRAPKFASNQKVSSARFVKVSVNGVVVQENVQVAEQNGEARDDREQMAGPLVFVGEGGAFALRNIRYKSYERSVALSGLRYRVYEGDAMDASYAASHAAVREGVATSISPDVAVPQDKFAVTYDGTMNTPTAGTYRFGLSLGWIGNDSATRGPSIGGGLLSVDGRPVVNHTGAERRAVGDVELTAGTHAISVSYYKNRPQFNRRDIAITVEGPGVERQSLSDDSPVGFGGNSPVNPILVNADAEPVLLRSFVRHRNTKRVIAISVADPRGVHYTYDLAQGSLLYVWRGPFMETTQMWHERGEDQTAEPLGSTVTLPGVPSVVHLESAAAAWPDSLDDRELHREGYQLDKSGHPTFLYRVHGVAVEDALRADLDGLSLHRALRLHAPQASTPTSGMYVQLARAEHIVRERDGSYTIGDRTYYIMLPSSGVRPTLRRVNGADELIVPVRFNRGESSVSYSIVW